MVQFADDERCKFMQLGCTDLQCEEDGIAGKWAYEMRDDHYEHFASCRLRYDVTLTVSDYRYRVPYKSHDH